MRARPGRWVVVPFAVCATILAHAPRARANSRYPSANQLVIDPGNPLHIVARTTFGIVVTSNAGASWSWICETAFAGGPATDPPIAVPADRPNLLGTATRLARGGDGGFGWGFAPSGKRRQ